MVSLSNSSLEVISLKLNRKNCFVNVCAGMRAWEILGEKADCKQSHIIIINLLGICLIMFFFSIEIYVQWIPSVMDGLRA